MVPEIGTALGSDSEASLSLQEYVPLPRRGGSTDASISAAILRGLPLPLRDYLAAVVSLMS